MAAPNPRIVDFSLMKNEADSFAFLEKRMDYDGSNNLIYVGFNRKSNENTSSLTWYIIKLIYTGSNLTRVQLPDLGAAFSYAWASRTTYFS